MAPVTPECFGDYELVERLGVGGMAEKSSSSRLPTFVGSEFVEMFLREARLSLHSALHLTQAAKITTPLGRSVGQSLEWVPTPLAPRR